LSPNEEKRGILLQHECVSDQEPQRDRKVSRKGAKKKSKGAKKKSKGAMKKIHFAPLQKLCGFA
jgi:hypothetical protein